MRSSRSVSSRLRILFSSSSGKPVASLLVQLPAAPGVYLMRGRRGRVLYVGKAKNLRARLRAYFAPRSFLPPRPHPQLDLAKRKLIAELCRLDYIVTNTEAEALLLESTLINRWRPPYNVVLEGDRGIIYIALTGERFPRLVTTRRPDFRYARCFGPYPSARRVRQLLRILRRFFPLRTCTLNLAKPRRRPCLLYEMRRCLAPCTRACSEQEYGKAVEGLIKFLQGKQAQVQAYLAARMREAARKNKFELAAHWRDLLAATHRLFGQQKVISPRPLNEDVFALSRAGGCSAICAMQVRGGRLVDVKTFRLRHPPKMAAGAVLDHFLCQYYAAASAFPSCIVVSHTLPACGAVKQWLGSRAEGRRLPAVRRPRRGKSLLLLEMGLRNARRALEESRHFQVSSSARKQAVVAVAKIAGLPPRPLRRIEAYDVSMLGGGFATGAMAVFENGLPARAQYRWFRIRNFSRPNDTGMLGEILARRLRRHHWNKPAGWPRPDLILVDGGRAQCLAAARVLLRLRLRVPVLSLAKKREEIYLPSRAQPLRLPRSSPALKLLQHLRDEAHRFTLRYHRNLRRRALSRSLLQNIPGIGPVTSRKLLSCFSSWEELQKASPARLASLVGVYRARILRAAFKRILPPKINPPR